MLKKGGKEPVVFDGNRRIRRAVSNGERQSSVKTEIGGQVRRWMKENTKENRRLEFKLRIDLSGVGAKAEFIRDVISLANSEGEAPREHGHLVIGFRDGERRDIRGEHYDGATFSQILEAHISPAVDISYEEFSNGSSGRVGVLVVKPDPNVLYVVRKKLNDDKGNAQLLPGQCWGRKNAGRKVELDGEAIQARFCEIINRRIEEVTEVLQEKIDELEHGGGPVLEVKRIRFEMEATQDWDALENNLQKLIPYAREFGLVVKHEVLDAVSVATDRTRQGMPVHVAQAAEYVLSELMPVGWGGMLHPARKKVSDDDQKLLERIEHITFDITWDACRYLRDLGVVKVGAERYWALIRFATLNGLQRLQGLLLENARRCRDMCNEERGRGTFPEGWAAMDDEIEDALNLPEHSNRSVPPT